MKKLIILISVVLTSCGSNHTDTQKTVRPKTSKKNMDSINQVKHDIENHWKNYKSVYRSLKIDSLKVDSNESYRVVILHRWGRNPYGGQPTSITFHKSIDTCYVVTLDLYSDTIKSVIHKSVKFVSTNYFDSIRVMFDKGTFWQHPIITTRWDRRRGSICTDPDYVFFEAVKNGRHKLVAQYEQRDSIPILRNWKYIFYHFSNYNKRFEMDFEKSKHEYTYRDD